MNNLPFLPANCRQKAHVFGVIMLTRSVIFFSKLEIWIEYLSRDQTTYFRKAYLTYNFAAQDVVNIVLSLFSSFFQLKSSLFMDTGKRPWWLGWLS